MRKSVFFIGFVAIDLAASAQAESDPLTLSDLGSPTGALHGKSSSLDQSLMPGAYREQLNSGSRNEDRFSVAPSAATAAQDAQGIVSIRELQHKIPRAAQKARDRAHDVIRQGRTQEGLDELLKAVSIDPGFTDAYDELGTVYASTGNLKQAVKEFRRALDLDPHHRRALSNLCINLGKLGELEEAGRVGRRALQFDPVNTGVHYVLAISLLNTSGESPQALDHLQRAAGGVPMAHLVAAQLLIANGRRAEARQHLKDYLAVAASDEVHRPTLESLLRELQE